MTGIVEPAWLATVRRYLLASALGHLVWEFGQLPLYTLWHTGSGKQIAGAILHCGLGDLSIALVALVIALAMVGAPDWPNQRFGVVIAVTVVVGAGYTIYSEYVNTTARQNWSYTPFMPTLPWLGTGLTPFVQWLIVPCFALLWARRVRPKAS